MEKALFALIGIPSVAGLLTLVIPKKYRGMREALALLSVVADLALASWLFGKDLSYVAPWGGYGMDFILRLYRFSDVLLLAAAAFSFLVILYSTVFMNGRERANQFYAYLLLTLAFFNGAVLADNFTLMFFFWEAILLTIYGMIAINGGGSPATAAKAFLTTGLTDLCLMFGIGLAGTLASTQTMSQVSLPLAGLGGLAFIFIAIGAVSRAGAMPFHSWQPEAAADAPVPFMAFLPSVLNRLLGIYLVVRLVIDFFPLQPGAAEGTYLMILGAITLVLASLLALVQSDLKRMLAYLGISQAGYMLLGLGTAVPAGLAGGLFHLFNSTLYISGLFLIAGAVEKEEGTTELSRLGGIGMRMPVTLGSFLILAAALAGLPPLNGFFSLGLICTGALERGWIYLAAALVGAFLTAAAVLKMGHAAFFGTLKEEDAAKKEMPLPLLVPVVALSFVCLLFGIYNPLPHDVMVGPILGAHLAGNDYAGFPVSMPLTIAIVIVIILALVNHLQGVKQSGSAANADAHLRATPGLNKFFDCARTKGCDPYHIGMRIVEAFAGIAFAFDRGIDWLYNTLAVRTAYLCSNGIRALHTGSYSLYLVWALTGAALVVWYIFA